MKVTLRILVITVSLAITFLSESPIQVVAQPPTIQNRAALPDVEVISVMRADDTVEATGIPRADLMIKEMCLDNNPNAATSAVGVLIVNIGSVDAGPFELGFEYLGSEGSVRFAVDKIGGLKAGEDLWTEQAHICCGWAPRSLVYGASSFRAIADPRYYSKGFADFPGGEVKSKVPESNEGNNTMLAKKSELRPCGMVDKKVDPRMPKKLQPVMPRKP